MKINDKWMLFRQKIALIILGLFLSIILLEIGLRLGGFIILSLQEHRNRIAIQQKGTYRIMCLGESTTAGGPDSYPSQLEEILNQRSSVIKFGVINKGRGGTTTSVIISELEGNLNTYKPDMVITMMGINDNDRYVLYNNASLPRTALFFNSFRIYKLTRLLWAHAINKISKIQLCKLDNKNIAYAFLSNAPIESEENTLSRNNPRHIEQALNKDIKINSNNDNICFELGMLYMREGKYRKAYKLFRKAVDRNPKNAMAYIGLGIIYRDRSIFSKAEKMYNRALELDCKNYKVYFELGVYYKLRKKYALSRKMFLKAKRLKPDYDWVYFELGGIYIMENKYLEAEKEFKKVIKINPINDRGYAGLVERYKKINNYVMVQKSSNMADRLRIKYYDPIVRDNYRKLKEILDRRKIKLVCMQYPMRSIKSLNMIFALNDDIIFVDNERIFKQVLKKEDPKDYFSDMFGGDFGHCMPKGNRLIAENIANIILKECFSR